MDDMTEVGPIPPPLFDELDLESDAVLFHLLTRGRWPVVHRLHPQLDVLRYLDGGLASQVDGHRKQNAHAVVRHINDLCHDLLVLVPHPTRRRDLAPWVQAFEALQLRHDKTLAWPNDCQRPSRRFTLPRIRDHGNRVKP